MIQVSDHHHTGQIGLALAGGGPEGAVYEIGVLRALDEALDGLDFNAVPVTVGVSAGAFIGASLANGITTAQLVRSVVGGPVRNAVSRNRFGTDFRSSTKR